VEVARGREKKIGWCRIKAACERPKIFFERKIT
jgi:hypothetical protein